MSHQHFDVLIIGAGISGISAACHLKQHCPKKTFAILERRHAIGGTWDLFRYPGIRSDSDMSTFGFNFRPWTEPKVLADGPSIRNYVNDTAQEYGVLPHINFGRRVSTANWSSDKQLWTLNVTNDADNSSEVWTADFVISCTGYYNYDQGFRPQFAGEDTFKGQIIHPQHWPENLDYTGKKVVIIGSGATAVTLVPSMTDKAAHVTMLQRSPSYVATVPAIDFVHAKMLKVLPTKVAYKLTRARNIGLQRFIYEASRKKPQVMRRLLLAAVRRQVGDKVDMKHFTPSYNPWDERLCAVPNGDLFKVLRQGKASIVTDHIDRFDATGITLKSGEHLDADIIVAATGLNIQMLGGATMSVDGKSVAINERMTYKGVLLQDVPNAAMIFGYTNSSWTLKADIANEYICRLLNTMDKKGYNTVVASDRDNNAVDTTIFGGSMRSGYIQRASTVLPRQGKKAPWQILNNYLADRVMLQKEKIEDGILKFGRGKKKSAA